MCVNLNMIFLRFFSQRQYFLDRDDVENIAPRVITEVTICAADMTGTGHSSIVAVSPPPLRRDSMDI